MFFQHAESNLGSISSSCLYSFPLPGQFWRYEDRSEPLAIAGLIISDLDISSSIWLQSDTYLNLHRRPTHEYRCDARLKARVEESTLLWNAGFVENKRGSQFSQLATTTLAKSVSLPTSLYEQRIAEFCMQNSLSERCRILFLSDQHARLFANIYGHSRPYIHDYLLRCWLQYAHICVHMHAILDDGIKHL